MSKIDLLLKAIADPGQFTPEQLEAILADPEMRRLYYLLSHAADVSIQPSEIDIDAEWNRFAAENPAVRSGFRFNAWRRLVPMRVVASAIIFFAIAAVAAGIAISRHISSGSKYEAELSVAKQGRAVTPEEKASEATDTILVESVDDPQLIFDNETLDAILTRIASEKGAHVDFRSETTRSLRLYFKWHRSQPLSQTIELLNGFDQIDIRLHNDTITVD